MRYLILFLLTLFPVLANESLEMILKRMDAEAPAFKGATAKMKRIEYDGTVKTTVEEVATMTFLRKKNSVQALLEFTEPDKKSYAFHDRELQEFLPKLNQVNIYDAGKYSKLANELISLGFGSSGKDLLKTYEVKLLGTEALKIADSEIKATKLELIPRSAEGRKRWNKIEFWIPETKAYAVQLKIYQDHNSTDTAIYSNVQINPPTLSEKSVELKLPKDAKKEYINR